MLSVWTLTGLSLHSEEEGRAGKPCSLAVPYRGIFLCVFSLACSLIAFCLLQCRLDWTVLFFLGHGPRPRSCLTCRWIRRALVVLLTRPQDSVPSLEPWLCALCSLRNNRRSGRV